MARAVWGIRGAKASDYQNFTATAANTIYGCPVVIDTSTGRVTACANNAISAVGWQVCTNTAALDIVRVLVARPGIQVKMAETGTWLEASQYDLVGLTLSGTTYTVDYSDTSNELLKPINRATCADGTYKSWVEISSTLSQAMLEVD